MFIDKLSVGYGFGIWVIIAPIFFFPIVPNIAIVLGILSLWRIHKYPALLKGKGIAWLGIVLGGLMILAWIGWISWLWLLLSGHLTV
jgi:hypothetical protein